MNRGSDGEKLGLSERVLAMRKRRGLTQEEAARQIGVSRKTMWRIENDYWTHRNTRAKVRAWLEAQEEAVEAEEREAAARERRRDRAAKRAVVLVAGRVMCRKIARQKAEAARGKALSSQPRSNV